ncbi:MAG: DUF1295 domain-containing protein [Planctomycetaceae bacterium]|nr:DUF1295 domain-containing protein [Planctomycetaceae bacterium]
MDVSHLLLLNGLLILGMMVVLWIVSIPLRDVSIVDIFWGPGFIMVAWASYLFSIQQRKTCYLLPLMVTLWGLRLAVYLASRNWGKGEDARYAALRRHAGPSFAATSLLTVFGLQGVVMWVISLPLQLGIPANLGVLNTFTYLGLGLWGLGLACETLGDWQLARFRARPENRGKVLDRGLWRYTRHPNYFGDFLVWWGFWFVAVSPGMHYWTIISPLGMSVLLMFISGVTLLERGLRETKPDYAEYAARTQPFFPWFPKARTTSTGFPASTS